MNNQGWIAVHRQLQDSEIWSKPDKWLKIWLYILLNVSHSGGKFPRGTYFFRYDWISSATGATYNQVEKCIIWLRKNGNLATQKATQGIIITVLNYAKYQDINGKTLDPKATQKAGQKRLKSDNISNNDNNGNNDINKSMETSIQKVVNHFFQLKEWNTYKKEDFKKLNIIYGRYTRPAKELLELCDESVEVACQKLTALSAWANWAGVDFSIETAIKKWFELDSLPAMMEKNRKAFIDGDRAYEKNGDWWVILRNGEHKKYIGSLDKIIWK